MADQQSYRKLGADSLKDVTPLLPKGVGLGKVPRKLSEKSLNFATNTNSKQLSTFRGEPFAQGPSHERLISPEIDLNNHDI